MDFDGPPLEERNIPDAPRRLDYDTLKTVAEMINGIFISRGLQVMIELEETPVQPTLESIEAEKIKLYQRAGELAIGEDIKKGLEILFSESLLDL